MAKKQTTKGQLIRMPRPGNAGFSVESRILFLRKRRVILDADLAELYGVPVRQLNQQIKRNQERFPDDFVFQLTAREQKVLRSQIVISKKAAAVADMRLTPLPSMVRLWRRPY